MSIFYSNETKAFILLSVKFVHITKFSLHPIRIHPYFQNFEFDRQPLVVSDNNRTNRFAIVAMQSSYGKNNIKDYRYDILRNWVFKYDKNEETKVYGKWAELFTNNFSQFKGFLPSNEIDKIFEDTRYTLVIPIRPNWVTSKYAEMLRVGVVPFV